MKFKFVDMKYLNEHNPYALVLLDGNHKITHFAYQDQFYPALFGYSFKSPEEEDHGIHIGFVHDSAFFTEDYNQWRSIDPFFDSFPTQIIHDPIEELSAGNTSGLDIHFADVTTTSKFLWRSNVNYASREKVRNKSALIVLNSKSDICFIAQSLKFCYVLPEEVEIHKIYDSPQECKIKDSQDFYFDGEHVWEKV